MSKRSRLAARFPGSEHTVIETANYGANENSTGFLLVDTQMTRFYAFGLETYSRGIGICTYRFFMPFIHHKEEYS